MQYSSEIDATAIGNTMNSIIETALSLTALMPLISIILMFYVLSKIMGMVRTSETTSKFLCEDEETEDGPEIGRKFASDRVPKVRKPIAKRKNGNARGVKLPPGFVAVRKDIGIVMASIGGSGATGKRRPGSNGTK